MQAAPRAPSASTLPHLDHRQRSRPNPGIAILSATSPSGLSRRPARRAPGPPRSPLSRADSATTGGFRLPRVFSPVVASRSALPAFCHNVAGGRCFLGDLPRCRVLPGPGRPAAPGAHARALGMRAPAALPSNAASGEWLRRARRVRRCVATTLLVPDGLQRHRG